MKSFVSMYVMYVSMYVCISMYVFFFGWIWKTGKKLEGWISKISAFISWIYFGVIARRG